MCKFLTIYVTIYPKIVHEVNCVAREPYKIYVGLLMVEASSVSRIVVLMTQRYGNIDCMTTYWLGKQR